MTIKITNKVTGEIVGEFVCNKTLTLKECIELLDGEIIEDMDDPRWMDDPDCNVIIDGKRYQYDDLEVV